MKTLLTLAALLAGLAGPALAEDAATPLTPPPQAEAAATPAPDSAVPAALPQPGSVQVVPLSAPAGADGDAMSRGDGGCHHGGSTVYLTN